MEGGGGKVEGEVRRWRGEVGRWRGEGVGRKEAERGHWVPNLTCTYTSTKRCFNSYHRGSVSCSEEA